jgi:tRNA (guanosine-2'-O-)-methyltransferase
MDIVQKKSLIEYLSEFITLERKMLLETVLEDRSNFLTIVLEDIFQAQNASAVLRTADCLGLQSVHVIEHRNKYKVNPDVALGANKWLNLNYYKDTHSCISTLKNQGYLIAATALHEQSICLTEFNPNQKTALVFGTEMSGVSDDVKAEADVFIKIPMYGFTESYNISVAAGISMFHLTNNLRTQNKWKLGIEDKINLHLNWLRKTVKNAHLLEENFLSSQT